jgi:ribosomal protein S18 acetylase RimI-like enzyme
MKATDLTIRPYRPDDEIQWIRCRVLAFLDSAYFDDVQQRKPRYSHPAVELVAESPVGVIAGFIDVECEQAPGTVCSSRPGLGGMIWNLGVHPDWRGHGVASRLLSRAIQLATELGLVRLEVWTRDDPEVLAWYKSHGFNLIDTYLHVYLDFDEAKLSLVSQVPGLKPIKVFAQFTDAARFERIRSRFGRVHDCNLFELDLKSAGQTGNDKHQ